MKRDLTTYLVSAILLLAVLVLAAPQINRALNPVAYNIPAAPNAQVPQPPFPTAFSSNVISGTETISPTNIISGTGTISPTATVVATATISPTETVSPTNIISGTGTISPTATVVSTANISTTANVKIQNFAFAPAQRTVPVGTTVKWTQLDPSVPHTVSAGSPAQPNPGSPFNSGPLTLNGVNTYEFTFQQPGVYPYYCTFHNEMTASVSVTDAQGNAPTPVPGTPAPTATPFTAPPPANATLIGKELINPRGFTLGPDGAFYIAEAGTVPVAVDSTATISSTVSISSTSALSPTETLSPTIVAPTASAPPAQATVNPICESQLPSYDKQAAGCVGALGPQVSNKGRISRIARDGTRTTVAENLPVTVGPFNDVFGVNSVAFVGNNLYVVIAAGASRGHPDFATGVYRVQDDNRTNGTTTLVADLEAFQKADPPKFIPPDYNYTLPYDMLSLDDKLYITDGNAAVVFEVDPAKPLGSNIQRIIDLSPTHNVLTGITATPDGTIYFTEFTPAPYPIGGAQIFKWSAAGGLSTVTAGLSIATGIALAPDGTMYASEFATDLGKAPIIAPPGRIVKISADGTTTTVATPLVYPTSLRWFNGALYVTNYGVDAIDGQPGNGGLYRIALP